MRLFKPWGMTQPKIFKGDMHKAWSGLKSFANASGARFLVGVSVTCEKWRDEQEWNAGREFIKYVGAKHIMGLAIGNEIDLQVGASNPHCIDELWQRGGYERILLQRVKEFDALPGVKGLPISAVLSMQSMRNYPFIYKVKMFLENTYRKLGERFVMSINVYPQFNAGLKNAGCHKSAMIGSDFSASDPATAGFMPNLVKDIRKRMGAAGLHKAKLWVGETGWSTHSYCVLQCPEACRSRATQERFYRGFLNWNLTETMGGSKSCGPAAGKCLEAVNWGKNTGIRQHPEWYPELTVESTADEFQDHLASKQLSGCPHTCDWEAKHGDGTSGEDDDDGPKNPEGADHVFYFTLRDSYVFNSREEFGIVNRCGNPACKFRR
eukprot:TRINITY_DN24849_c0_g1_i2.p1 TRINITY_DN24849_c0_g1~~TRINITY_DN24849_c0_g1_i2.p1  ORF type:complete len:379 (-),score=64.51 TRINITY_DN24849_c0_g1_i2:28-1164(-)